MLIEVRSLSPEDLAHHERRAALDRPLIESILGCDSNELVRVAAEIGLPVSGLTLQDLRDALFGHFRALGSPLQVRFVRVSPAAPAHAEPRSARVQAVLARVGE